jgi:hypothetical protein
MIEFSSVIKTISDLSLNMCLIVFGGVVVKGLFGDGSDKDGVMLAVVSMLLLFVIGISLSIFIS